MHWHVLKGDVTGLDQPCSNAVRDGLDELALRGPLRVVDTKDVLLLGRRLEDLLDHAGQVLHVNRGYEVLTLAHDWQLNWVLLPCSLEVVVEDGFTETVEDTSRDNKCLDVLLFEVQDAVFNLLDLGVLAGGHPIDVVLLLERIVQELLALALRGSRGYIFFLRLFSGVRINGGQLFAVGAEDFALLLRVVVAEYFRGGNL